MSSNEKNRPDIINPSQFKVRFFDENVDLKGCKLIISTVEFGLLGYNSIMELIWLLKAKYVGYGINNDKITLTKMIDGLPGTTFPFYKKDNMIFLSVSSPIPNHLSEGYTRNLIEWAVKKGFDEIYIIGAIRLFQIEDANQIRFYSRKYLKMNKSKEFPYLKNGLALGGVGPGLFIYSDFFDFISVGVFLGCDEPEDNIKFIPKGVKILRNLLKLDFDYDSWRDKFSSEFDEEMKPKTGDVVEVDGEGIQKSSDYI